MELTRECVLPHSKCQPFKLEITPTFHLKTNVEIPLLVFHTHTPPFNIKILYLEVFNYPFAGAIIFLPPN